MRKLRFWCMFHGGTLPVPSLALHLQLFPLAYEVFNLIQGGRSHREYIITVLFASRRNESIIVNFAVCEPYPFRHSWGRFRPVSYHEPHLHALPHHHRHHPCPFPVIDLLSHPTLGVRRTRGSSSKVRVARQGTEFSSGLRALVPEAEDRRRRTHEQPQQGWGWKHWLRRKKY